MKKTSVQILLFLTLVATLTLLSCENNVYMDPYYLKDSDLWMVNGKYFPTLQEAMDYIYETTKSKSMDTVPAERIAVLQRDVMNGNRGGGLIVPEGFEGQLIIDFNSFTYEFDDSLDHFFLIKGGDEVYITNGTTVIYNEADHEPYALAINTDVVTIDSHLIDDRRWDPTTNTSNLVDVGVKGSLVITNISAVTDDDSNETSVMKGVISVVTDGTTGGKIKIENSRVVVDNILTRYQDENGDISDSIPEETSIDEEAKTDITISSGHVTINKIETLSDYYIKEESEVTLFSKAKINIFSEDAEDNTKIENPHDTEEDKIDTAIQTIINTTEDPEVPVDHEIVHEFDSDHTYAAVEPTCTEDGHILYYQCTICYDYFDAKGNKISDITQTVANGGTIIPALGHSLVHHEAVEPTCTETGNTEYWICSRCGEYFTDEGATTGTTQSETVIPALGHNWGDWTEDNEETHSRTCSRCGETETESHNFTDWVYDENFNGTRYCTVCGRVDTEDHVHAIVHVEAKSPTCTEDGNTEYWKCLVCDELFANAQGTIPATAESVVIAATGHNWSTDWTHDETDHWHICLNGCGATTGTAVHTFSEWTYSSTDGKDHRECTCGRTEERAHVHVLIEHAAVSATCENEGNSAHWECSKCNRYYSDADGTEEITLASTVINALGHDYSASWTYDDNNHWHVCSHDSSHKTGIGAHTYPDTWTYDSELQANVKACTVCGKKIIENHDTHTSDTWVTTDPEQHYKVCTVCNTYFDYQDHSFSDWSYDSDLNKDKRTCSVCGRVETRTHVHGTTANNTLTHTAAVSATCTADGNKEYWYCTLCNRYYLDEDCTIETTLDGTVTEKLGHHISEHKTYKAATCTEDGNIEYWYCDRCQTYFSDSSYTTEITQAQTVISKTGHTTTYTYDDDHHWIECGNCGETINYGEHVWGEEHTCEDGNHKIRECIVCGAIRNADIPPYEEFETSIGTLLVPGPENSPCGDLVVTRSGNCYTVRFNPHQNSNTNYDLNCRYQHNGVWSNYLTKNSATNGDFTFVATDNWDYLIYMQVFNQGGNITRIMVVNNLREIGE